ncbi:MAG: CDP-alcohol phosphatidyltransferase family protein, partial [Bryobacteraceae bacterium]
MRYLPNVLTSLRFAAAPFIAWLLVVQDFRPALGVVLFAGVTDWLDGFTARRLGVTGKTGAILDPLADKSLLVLLF